MRESLPPGQRSVGCFPRFGLTRFAERFPRELTHRKIIVGGLVEQELDLADALHDLPRVDEVSDFHCVTTWSYRSLHWGGVRFADFYRQVLVPRARPHPGATLVALRGQDGAHTGMLLEDLLAPNVLLADTLDGQPLGIAHGAPLRLIAPAHYGYKSVKHLSRIEFALPGDGYRMSAYAFTDHPRARVALEERGRGVPGWLLRYLYRTFVPGTIARFSRALDVEVQRRGHG